MYNIYLKFEYYSVLVMIFFDIFKLNKSFKLRFCCVCCDLPSLSLSSLLFSSSSSLHHFLSISVLLFATLGC